MLTHTLEFAIPFVAIFLFVWGCFSGIQHCLVVSSQTFSGLPLSKQLYVTKNITKSLILASISVFGMFIAAMGVIYDHWDNPSVYVLGTMYASIDTFALIKVPNLPRSTVIHHTATTLMACLNLKVDYAAGTIWRGVVLYGILATQTWIVNFYLGVRMLYPNKHVSMRVLCSIAFFVYSAALVVAWIILGLQVIPRFAALDLSTVLFTIFMISIVNDDIVLLRHLRKNMTSDPEHVQQVTGLRIPLPSEMPWLITPDWVQKAMARRPSQDSPKQK